MNKQIKLILGVAALMLLLICAGALYSTLSNKYAAVPPTAQEPQSQEPVKAVDFTIADMDGKEVKLSDFIGKPIIVNFWASWCGPCKQEMPHFEKAYKTYGSDISFIMINMTNGRETEQRAQDYIAKEGYTFPIYFDTIEQNAANTYGITSIPSTMFIDKDGQIVEAVTGSMSSEALEKYILKIK